MNKKNKAQACEITVLSCSGGQLNKTLKLDKNGKLVKTPIANMDRGYAQRTPVVGASGHADVIRHLKAYQGIALGRMRDDLPDKVKVTTKGLLNGSAGVIARDREHLPVYREGYAAIVLLDFDDHDKPANIVVKDFWKTLLKVCPALRNAERVIRASTSSGLYRLDNGDDVPGSSGMHIFIIAKDGSDIERVLKAMFERAWLHGLGWIMIAENGRMLLRSIIDQTVWKPEGIVFEAAATLEWPLAQRPEGREPVVIEGEIIDTRIACPSLNADERKEYDRLVAKAKEEKAPEAEQVKVAYDEARIANLTSGGMTREAARAQVDKMWRGVLTSDMVLLFNNQALRKETITVKDVLDDPERFKGKYLGDPAEPSLPRDKAQVILRQSDGWPWIKVYAHGVPDTSYSLEYTKEDYDKLDALGQDRVDQAVARTADLTKEKGEKEDVKPAAETSDVSKKNGGGKKMPPQQARIEVHKVCRKWLGEEYDLNAIDATCAAAASEQLTGDPLWLLVISGPGAAKTETIQSLMGSGAHVISTIASEGALLSASPKKGRAKDATGGLLRKIGARGILVIKDFASILSAARETRGTVLAAIREIYDGTWVRHVGTDGGQTLSWMGRLVIIGAVTTAWDAHHAVVASMGDRFVLIRFDSSIGRVASGKRAIGNTGSEVEMRKELSDAVAVLMANVCIDAVMVTEDEIERILKAADITTMARTAVERDYKGEVLWAHAPEMPTRFAKQLTQMVRGGVAIGMEREDAMRLAIRCARDSIPPMRLEILLDLASNSFSQVADVRKRTGKPWSSTKRELEALTMLGMVKCDEESVIDDIPEEGSSTGSSKTKTKWEYELDPGFDRTTLLAMMGMDPTPPPIKVVVPPSPPRPPKSGVRFGVDGGGNQPRERKSGAAFQTITGKVSR